MLDTEITRLAAVRAGNQNEFAALIEPYRRELLAHCYRMLGSAVEAEDIVQETFLRAWRRLDTFQQPVSFRAWLYRIATNACLDTLDKQRRRTLPTLAYPAADPHSTMAPPIYDRVWLEPIPDEWLVQPESENPETRFSIRESVTLAFVAALQCLPPRQRAVLILRDVLDWPASETAELLTFTVSAVNSTLHRARRTLALHYQREERRPSLENTATRRLLERYVRAWETADVAGLLALLKEEATFVMPPWPAWYHGREDIRAFLEKDVFNNTPADYARLIPLRGNARPGFALYHWDISRAEYLPFAIQLLTIEGQSGQLADILNFVGAEFFPVFGLPPSLPASG